MRRFWDKVNKWGDTDCWEWTAARNLDGYGAFRLNGKTEQAHRVALMLQGEDITDKVVMHTCDNPACCNPAHLVIGTQADNIHDMEAKGRGNQPRGEANGRSNRKLTRKQVKEIRKRVASGETQQAVAKQFGIVQQQVSAIANRKQWEWLK